MLARETVMTLQLSPELESRLAEAAKMRGMEPEDYARQLLEQSLPPLSMGTGILTKEGLEEMLLEMAKGSENLPVLPTSAFSRESFYEGRD